MANQPVAGASFDLYREQVFNNPSTYAQSGTQVLSDDYTLNIQPQTPARPNNTVIANYSPQPILRGWHERVHGDTNKSNWTATFPVIPGT